MNKARKKRHSASVRAKILIRIDKCNVDSEKAPAQEKEGKVDKDSSFHAQVKQGIQEIATEVEKARKGSKIVAGTGYTTLTEDAHDRNSQTVSGSSTTASTSICTE